VGQAQIPLLGHPFCRRRSLLVAGYASYGLLYLLIGQLQSGSLWLYALFAGYGRFLSATEGVAARPLGQTRSA
jgi:hypothetical protein